MKKIRFFWCLICAASLVACLMLPVAAADISATNGSHSVDAAFPLSESKKLLDTSKAVILYERNSDTMVYAWNPDEKIYPASMTKIMTCLLSLEILDTSSKIEVTGTPS